MSDGGDGWTCPRGDNKEVESEGSETFFSSVQTLGEREALSDSPSQRTEVKARDLAVSALTVLREGTAQLPGLFR